MPLPDDVRALDVTQRTEAWYQARVGVATASRAPDIVATITKGEAAARRDYREQLVSEILTGLAQEDTFQNGAMLRGIELEPRARAVYEARTGTLVEPCGFLRHVDLRLGGSPDGVIGDYEGIIEIKCPKSRHMRWMRAGILPGEHQPQVLHSLLLSGARYCDFISFDDRWPDPLDLFVVRVPYDEVMVMAYAKVVRAFLKEVDAEVAAVEALREKRGAA